MKIGDFLLGRLDEAGVGHLFGVPGDYNLMLMRLIEQRGTPRWIGNCNELNASYAADAYARLNGLAGLVVTNGVGALSAFNGIAGAYSEHVPVVCVCGSLPLKFIRRGAKLHHSLCDEGQNNFFRAYSEITAAQTQLTHGNAVAEIDRMILTAWREKRPVYVELPSDICYLEIEVPEQPLRLVYPSSEPERLQSCATAILNRLRGAESPAILLDMDVERYAAEDQVAQLAEHWQMPVATMGPAKGAFPDTRSSARSWARTTATTTSRTGNTPSCRACSTRTPTSRQRSSRPTTSSRRSSTRPTTGSCSWKRSWTRTMLHPCSSRSDTNWPTRTSVRADHSLNRTRKFLCVSRLSQLRSEKQRAGDPVAGGSWLLRPGSDGRPNRRRLDCQG
jgi:glyoxylate carboligase